MADCIRSMDLMVGTYVLRGQAEVNVLQQAIADQI